MDASALQHLIVNAKHCVSLHQLTAPPAWRRQVHSCPCHQCLAHVLEAWVYGLHAVGFLGCPHAPPPPAVACWHSQPIANVHVSRCAHTLPCTGGPAWRFRALLTTQYRAYPLLPRLRALVLDLKIDCAIFTDPDLLTLRLDHSTC